MGKIKERRILIHKPSTQEILHCLSIMPSYSTLLLQQYPDKPYSEFLKWLIDKNYYKGLNKKITIKRISVEFKAEAVKVTKWIKEIYEEIIELNYDKPELFQTNGNKVCLEMKHYDSYFSFYTSLPIFPREYETLKFPFAEGMVGTRNFWVKKIEHEIIEDNALVTIFLVGEVLNKYREFALDKALFQGWIHYMDVYELSPFELEDEIKKIYRN